MSVVSVLVCNVGSSGCALYRPEVSAKSDGAARSRGAIHGWTFWDRFGHRYDACPVCTRWLREHGMAEPSAPGTITTDQLVAVLAGEATVPAAAPERQTWRVPAQEGRTQVAERPRVQHPVVLLPDGVDVCARCADGEHWLCDQDGCPCPVHGRLGTL